MNDQLLAGLKSFAIAFIPVIAGPIAVFAGMVLIGSAVKMMAFAEEESRSSGRGVWTKVGMRMLIGGGLLQLSSTMQGVSELLLGKPIESYRGVMAYAGAANVPGPWAAVLEVCMLWVVLLGWVAAFRGLIQWNTAASGGGGQGAGDYFWKGLWHIVGGGVAINLSGAISSFMGR